MSIKLMAQVWEYQFTHAEQSIMLALADHADDDGGSIFPSIARIAWKTSYSERQVQRILRDLEAQEVLVSVRHKWGGRGHATEYLMRLEKGVKKSPYQKKSVLSCENGDIPDEMGDTDDRKGDVPARKDDTALSPQPSRESSKETSGKRQGAPSFSNGYQRPKMTVEWDAIRGDLIESMRGKR